jgi:hypothetical protein
MMTARAPHSRSRARPAEDVLGVHALAAQLAPDVLADPVIADGAKRRADEAEARGGDVDI